MHNRAWHGLQLLTCAQNQWSTLPKHCMKIHHLFLGNPVKIKNKPITSDRGN